ncbi:MAG: mechanosensitive ion channel [Draconibacterium sp.]|nr:mechanosensitive ion channel [Draconibacterium sp.]
MELSPSYFKIIAFVLLIAIILISLKIVNFFAKRFLKNQQFRSFWNRYFGGLELFIWLVFGLLSIEYFIVYNKIIAIIIAVIFTLILFILVYYYFKEVLVRIFFKLTTDIKMGDEVKNDEFEGKITHIGSNQLIIERTDGSEQGIPYSKIIFNPLIKQSPSPYLHRFEGIFIAPVQSDRNSIQKQLISLLQSDLRVSGAVEPKVSFYDLNELNYQIKVIAFLFNPADTEPLRESLKTVLSE